MGKKACRFWNRDPRKEKETMNRKIVAILLAGSMVLGLAACGSSSDTESDASSSASEEETKTTSSGEDIHVEMIVKDTNEYFQRVMAGAQAYADEYENVTVEFASPTSQTDYDGQMNSIETALGSSEFDALIISPLQSTTVATLVEDTDKTIVAVDTDFTSDFKSSYVGTANEDVATEGATAAVELAQENGIDAPTAAIITGSQGDETQDARLSGYQAGIEDNGGTVIDTQYCDSDPAKVTTAIEAIIEKYPEGVDIILCTDDVSSVAAANVIEDSGNENYIENTILVGLDGTTEAIELVQSGQITIDIAQMSYDMGYISMETVVAAYEGEEVESYIDTGCELVTSENVEDYIADLEEKGIWEIEETETEEEEE